MYTGPWNLRALYKPPRVEWVDVTGSTRRLYYENEPYQGRLAKVFAYLSVPREVPAPAMVLVHGGGGHAFPHWAKMWSDRGYVAIAMDLTGCGEDGQQLPDGGPPLDYLGFQQMDKPATEQTLYHAVAAVIRANSLLRSLPQVDKRRIGITGISWGGHLTCIAAGLDRRLKVVIPVYGCGFLYENSAWTDILNTMKPEHRKCWIDWYDPSRYLSQVQAPTLWVNGTNDFAYPLDSYQKSYQCVKGRRSLCITVNMPHGHQPGWAPAEIGLFADEVLRGGIVLPRVHRVERDDDVVHVAIQSNTQVIGAYLHYTSDTGLWQKRVWKTVRAVVEHNRVEAKLPNVRPLAYFLTVTDSRCATVSTEHEVLMNADTK